MRSELSKTLNYMKVLVFHGGKEQYKYFNQQLSCSFVHCEYVITLYSHILEKIAAK
jgi:hypothetical protein